MSNWANRECNAFVVKLGNTSIYLVFASKTRIKYLFNKNNKCSMLKKVFRDMANVEEHI